MKEKMRVIFAHRDNQASTGPAHVQIVATDKLYRQEDRCALIALQESINLARRRVKIAEPENFLPKE